MRFPCLKLLATLHDLKILTPLLHSGVNMTIMTYLLLMFWTTCVLCFMVAFRFGARDEKRGMLIIAIGSMATAFVALVAKHDFSNLTIWLLLVDLCVLLAFLKLSFASRKYWPIWVSSLQLISIAIHILELLLPKSIPAAYAMLQGFWVYPMFFAIMAGTFGSFTVARRERSISQLNART